MKSEDHKRMREKNLCRGSLEAAISRKNRYFQMAALMLVLMVVYSVHVATSLGYLIAL